MCFRDFLYPGQSRLRLHGPPHGYGAELVRQLERAARAEPRIQLRLGTPVYGLLWDSRRVTGVQTDGRSIAAAGVILALNGFGGNREMVRRFLGDRMAGALYFGSPNNTGEGIAWGQELGAATAHMDAYQGHASVAAPDGPLVTWGTVVNGAILVNRAGRRFGCETHTYSEFAADVLRQPGSEAWEIFDQEVYDVSRDTRLEEVIATDKVVRASSLEQLAERFGLPPGALAETVAQVKGALVASSAIPSTARSCSASRSSRRSTAFTFAARSSIYRVVCVWIPAPGCCARVLHPDDTPIAGLYAGGGTAAGISGDGVAGYAVGNGLLAATALGKIADETAAAEALGAASV